MKTEDLETYKKDGTKASKSQLKEFIKLYATIAKEYITFIISLNFFINITLFIIS